MPRLPDIEGVRRLNDKNFEKFIENSEKPVLIIAGARWCSDTQRMMTEVYPVFVKVHRNELAFGLTEIEDDNGKFLNPKIRDRFHIKNFPAIIFLERNSKPIKKVSDQGAKEQMIDLERIIRS